MVGMTTLGDTNDPIMRALGERLTALQKERNLSLRKLEKKLIMRFGEEAPSYETVRAYHQGIGTVARANLGIIAAICQIYGVTGNVILDKADGPL